MLQIDDVTAAGLQDFLVNTFYDFFQILSEFREWQADVARILDVSLLDVEMLEELVGCCL